MATQVSIEGLQIQTKKEALQEGEGFLVRMNTSWNLDRDQRAALQKAQELDLIGQILNGHESTYGDAETRIATVEDQWETDITNFITDWNNGVYEES